jgi:hypothetical protein
VASTKVTIPRQSRGMVTLLNLKKEIPDDSPREPDHELEDRLSRRLLDVFIRAGLVLALVLLCYHIFSPFLTMMLWALILAITLYPLHQMLAGRIGGKQGLASTLIVLLAVAVIVTPTVMLASQFGDSVHDVVNGVRDNTLRCRRRPTRSLPGRWSARRCMRSGRRRTTTCRHWSRTCSPRSANWRPRHWASSPASAAAC